MEKYSVIIPVLNGEKTISQLIQSLFNQTLSPHEIIVVDNGSIDQTKKIVQKYPTVQYVFEEKQGRSIARNRGASLAKGDYLCFVDCDVILGHEWLEKCDSYLEENEVDLFTTSIIPVSEKNGVLSATRKLWGSWKTHGKFLSPMKYDNLFPVINTAACVIKKSIFWEFSGFNEKRFRNEDLEFSLRLALHGQLLGGSSLAKAEVTFLDNISSGQRLYAYFQRNIEIQKDLAQHNQFKFFSSLDFKFFVHLFFSGKFLILSLVLFNKIMGGLLAFPDYLKSSKKRETYSKIILFQYSFSDEKETYFPKLPFILMNLDGDFYINFNSKKFYLIEKELGQILIKLKNKKGVDQGERQILFASSLYSPAA